MEHQRSGRIAAFFDLDKTILAKSSSLAFARPFYQGGLISRADVLRSSYAQFMYLLGGADADQMEQMRQYLSALCRGWDVEQVRAIVAETLDRIVEPLVYAEAAALIDDHHAAGHDVIIISASGTEVVEPIGARLGADLSIGTQLEIADGCYTGDILFYAYGEGKAEAIRRLADERGYDLPLCTAYSDSITDLPMLEAVGFPHAVNPDSELRTIAEDRDWPVLDFARPVSLRSARRGTTAVAISAGAAAVGAVGMGVAWYARRGRR